MAITIDFDGASFKDPDGRVFTHEGRVYRTLSAKGRSSFEALTTSGLYDGLLGDGLLVETTLRETRALGLPEGVLGPCVLEHEKVPFVTYPYEWSFEMLRDAALATLEITERALRYDLILKDATPFNIQFVDAKPRFIDILSFEGYREHQPWVAYSQFCSMFLYPLMLTALVGIEFQPLLRGTLGLISVADMDRILSWRSIRKPGVLAHVKLVARLQHSFEKTDVKVNEAKFPKASIMANLAGLKKTLGKLRYRAEGAVWADYATDNSYSEADASAKREFVAQSLDRQRPGGVWDLGANVGVYSELAAQRSARVLAIDGDAAAVDAMYHAQKAGRRSARIQGIVGDLANPSPSSGWRLSERRSWAERGTADFFIAVALVHHLVISANVPVSQFVSYLRSVAPAGVTEFVTKDDPMVKHLLIRREDVFGDYTIDSFRAELAKHFRIEREQKLSGGTRVLFELCPVLPT